jgi:hypothetical protein
MGSQGGKSYQENEELALVLKQTPFLPSLKYADDRIKKCDLVYVGVGGRGKCWATADGSGIRFGIRPFDLIFPSHTFLSGAFYPGLGR